MPESPAPGSSPHSASGGEKLLKAGDLSRRTGLTRQSLHQYVLLGLLEPRGMTKGGQRLFGADAEERIRLIQSLLNSGYSLKEMRDIFFKRALP